MKKTVSCYHVIKEVNNGNIYVAILCSLATGPFVLQTTGLERIVKTLNALGRWLTLGEKFKGQNTESSKTNLICLKSMLSGAISGFDRILPHNNKDTL